MTFARSLLPCGRAQVAVSDQSTVLGCDALLTTSHGRCAHVHCPGNCGEDGRLSREEERALKSYTTKLQLFGSEDVVQQCLDMVRDLVGVSAAR